MRLAELALQGQTPPLLGVCLGHQALGLAAGGASPDPHGPVHGRPVQLVHDEWLFRDVSGQTMRLVRYNSLVVEVQIWQAWTSTPVLDT